MSQSDSSELDAILQSDFTSALHSVAAAVSKKLEAAGRRVVLAGSGHLGQAALRRCVKAGLEPVAFADNNLKKAGTEIGGVPVMPPLEAVQKWRSKAVFIVTVYTSEGVWDQLRQLGVEPMAFSRVAWAYPEAFLPRAALDNPRVISEHAEEIKRLFPLWADEASRREYLTQLRWRMTLSPELLRDYSPIENILFDPEVIRLSDHESLVDCGAFDGDTISRFLALTGGRFRSIAAFEPDGSSFLRLQEFVRDLPPSQADQIHLFESATGSAPGRIRFNSTGTMGSAIGCGESSVEIATLDDTVLSFSPSFIKMDVEGAEVETIRGASKLIRRFQPTMAICLYHTCQHLWEIPLLLKELVPSYNLSLRRYCNDCWEQICYAVPPNRSIAR